MTELPSRERAAEIERDVKVLAGAEEAIGEHLREVHGVISAGSIERIKRRWDAAAILRAYATGALVAAADNARMRAALERIVAEFPVEIAPWVTHAAKQALEVKP